jgi:diguanylate cyclase (GGDEF)-like protein/putative nucleotidyltransferase with HDIG domain
MRQLTSRPQATPVLLAVTAAFALCALEFTLHVSGDLRAFLNDWVYDNILFAAGAASLARGIAVRRDRLAWILMGLAVMSWGAGDTVWTVTIGDDPSPPAPSFADLGYLAVYPLAYTSIVLLLRSRMGTLRGGLWLDGVIGAFAIGSVGTAIILPAVIGTLGGSTAAVATNLAYPLADLILVALVVWALAVTGWRPGRTWGLLAAGLLVFAISDCLYLYHVAAGSYVEGSVTDLGWAAGGVLLAWAAWQPASARAGARSEGWPLLVPPVVFGLAGLGILVYDHFHRIYPVSLVLAGAAILAVIARMALTFAENMAMIGESRAEARTDVLTGLGNRRHLFDDLEQLFLQPEKRHVLVLFDLNGFKLYNDTFGHVAGDLLLARLGESLRSFVRGRGRAYRMGGDEFCIVVRDDGAETELVVAGAAGALSERGEGFAISAASGYINLPEEAAEADEALRLADQRMYARKQSSRVSAGEQSSGVLLRALTERHPKLGEHAIRVSELADALARKLGLSDNDVERSRLAGLLHDVGKMAIPDVILEKPGPLAEDEWQFVRDHSKIGERILHGAPDLVSVSGLVRSSLERFDGTGYPDGLVGTDIPLVSRIVFVCDAFDAMTSPRPFADAMTIDAALAELTSNSGTQFDPVVVAAFAGVVAERGSPHVALAS